MTDLTLQSFELRHFDPDVRHSMLLVIKGACTKEGVKLVLHRSDGIPLVDAEEQLFDRVYCGHNREVVKDRSTIELVRNEHSTTVEVVVPLRRRKPV
jgi:hypothetical protein